MFPVLRMLIDYRWMCVAQSLSWLSTAEDRCAIEDETLLLRMPEGVRGGLRSGQVSCELIAVLDGAVRVMRGISVEASYSLR